MWQATDNVVWRERAQRLLQRLQDIQNPDGGFDTGYDYNFGHWHFRGQSLGCETTALLAIAEYVDATGDRSPVPAAMRCAEWIVSHAIDVNDGKAMPYSPSTHPDDVAILNATSFAATALAVCKHTLASDVPALDETYRQMITFLHGQMQSAAEQRGRFWPYYDPAWGVMTTEQLGKVDHYHMAQQIEVHMLAQKRLPLLEQETIIADGIQHLLALQGRHTVLPYCSEPRYFNGMIHSWGLSAVIPAFLESAELLPRHASACRKEAEKVAIWLMSHAWNGRYFYDILTPQGEPVSDDHMVRSDAWVFHAMATAQQKLGNGVWTGSIEPCFATMEACDFSGPEKHGVRTMQRWFQQFERRA